MIVLPGWRKDVFEITENDVKLAERQLLNPDTVVEEEKVEEVKPAKKTSSRKQRTPAGPSPAKQKSQYVAPSTSVLAAIRNDEIELVIGHAVSTVTLQTVLGFGLKNRKLFRILKCEGLSILGSVDRMIALGNSIIKEQRSLTDDIPIAVSDDEEEDDEL